MLGKESQDTENRRQNKLKTALKGTTKPKENKNHARKTTPQRLKTKQQGYA